MKNKLMDKYKQQDYAIMVKCNVFYVIVAWEHYCGKAVGGIISWKKKVLKKWTPDIDFYDQPEY